MSLERFDNEKAYRADKTLTNYSALKLFSVCPNLYREQYLTKEFEPEDKDYFLYGLLVDCILTTPDDTDSRFVRVKTKVDPQDKLQFEVDIKNLRKEMTDPDKKGNSMAEKADAGNKTCIAGIAKREKEIAELEAKIKVIDSLGDKQQITNGMWQSAVDTVEAIKNNPTFQTLEFNEITSQQIFVDPVSKRKGITDHVVFHPNFQESYRMFRTGLLTGDKLRAIAAALPEEERTGWITDIKTTYLIKKFEPCMYAGQLANYQKLVEAVTGLTLRCRLVAGDKDSDVKCAQDYVFDQKLLDEAYKEYLEVETYFLASQRDNWYPSAKEIRGKDQECFRCSICRNRPLSTDAPLLVTGKLFEK